MSMGSWTKELVFGHSNIVRRAIRRVIVELQYLGTWVLDAPNRKLNRDVRRLVKWQR